ncbi:MAG: DUF4114 domain-containing protein [Prevotellaceae bacterium]|jgi:hypothetical protein|nr:DUF4114 domain-containing protein [Prevotellaceae bacterium]
MKKLFHFIKVVGMVFVGVGLTVSCQKENTPTPEGTIDGKKIKYAELMRGNFDQRNLGNSSGDWMSNTGDASLPLGFLQELRDLRVSHPEFFVNVPSGIMVKGKPSYIYISYLGEVADFNNVLGYYTYTASEIEAVDANDQVAMSEFILNKIFDSDSRNGVYFKNIVYARTGDIEFKTTYRIGKDNGEPLDAGTIVGFYLLPNSGETNSGEGVNIQWEGDRPIFIATDAAANKIDDETTNIISHIMGKTLCNDLIIAFEDLNSPVGRNSDGDYNDLVFLLGDNLESRATTFIEPWQYAAKPDDLPAFGENCDMGCRDETVTLSHEWINKKYVFSERDCKYEEGSPLKEAYAPLFENRSRKGHLLLTKNVETLYVYFQKTVADILNTVGWYVYDAGENPTAAEIMERISEGDYIKTQNILYESINRTNYTDYQGFIPFSNGNDGFKVDQRIGFFIMPRATIQTVEGVARVKVPVNVNNPDQIRFTTILTDGGVEPEDQTQLIMLGSCNDFLVAFEDIYKTSIYNDGDYNDLIFSVTDQNEVLTHNGVFAEGDYMSIADLLATLEAIPGY